MFNRGYYCLLYGMETFVGRMKSYKVIYKENVVLLGNIFIRNFSMMVLCWVLLIIDLMILFLFDFLDRFF